MSLKPEDRTLILQLALKKNLLPQFALHVYLLVMKQNEIKMLNKEGTFIFLWKDHLTTYGHLATIQTLLQQYDFTIDDTYEIYFPSHHLPAIQARFKDFELIDKSGSGNFNNFLCMSLDKNQFIPRRQVKNGKKIKNDFLKELNPELAHETSDGLVYGIIEDTELISVAPAPYILETQQLSYAILGNVWTKEESRGQGYATGAVRSILNFLFTRKAIKTIYCLVEEKNVPATKLFERIGFLPMSAQMWMATKAYVKDTR